MNEDQTTNETVTNTEDIINQPELSNQNFEETLNTSAETFETGDQEATNEVPDKNLEATEVASENNPLAGASLVADDAIELPANSTPEGNPVQEEGSNGEQFVLEDPVFEESFDIFNSKFKINYENAKSKEEAIYKGTKYRITVLSNMLIRLEYSETGVFEDRPTELARFRNFELPAVDMTDENNILTLTTKYFELKYEKDKPFEGRKLAPDEFLKVSLLGTDKVWFYNHAEARNFRSNTISLDEMKTKPHLEKGLYSTDGFVSLDDSNSLIFNEDGTVGKRTDQRIDIYLFMYKKDFGFCLKNYYKLTGYPPMIPRYALGVWWDKDEELNKERMERLFAKFKKTQVPLSVVVLNNWSDDDVHFKDGENIIKIVKDNNAHCALPMKLEAVKFEDQAAPIKFNVFDKLFIEKYFREVITPLTDLGVDFYKIRFRENDLYTLRTMNHYFYKFQESEENRSMILSRNGLINAHMYPVQNGGETLVNWSTLTYLPEYNATSSNIGVSYWSHPIGGFKEGVEDPELYTRYVQLGTFSPIFRLASKAGRYYKREPWTWDVKTRKIVRDYTTLRHRLIPYLYSECYKYSKTGLPLLQPLYYRYPELYDEPKYKNEYYFGTELFICPITMPKDKVMNRAILNIFLPNGLWYDFKTGKKFPGGRRYISFFLDEDFPVFAKQGAIIPLNNFDINNKNDVGNPSNLEVHIFPGHSNTYKIFEDDGVSNKYKNGDYLISVIDYNYLPNNFTVIIRPVEGSLAASVKKRSYKIRFRNTRKADDVIVFSGERKLDESEIKTSVDDTDFIVEVKDIPMKEQLSINCKGKDIEIDAVRIINDDIDRIISDLSIPTNLKEKINSILFDPENDIKKKRIELRKLKKTGLNERFIKMFLKLLDYVSQI